MIHTNFNPRTRVGCDDMIHVSRKSIYNFNPRTRVGCDSITDRIGDKLCKFQSTHPCRVRLTHWKFFSNHNYFNPRTRVGCDSQIQVTTTFEDDFNPRTRVGCDNDECYLRKREVFQSTHPCRVRRNKYQYITRINYFNPRTRVGCDVVFTVGVGVKQLFQSTHPCRVRPEYRLNLGENITISIHAPV